MSRLRSGETMTVSQFSLPGWCVLHNAGPAVQLVNGQVADCTICTAMVSPYGGGSAPGREPCIWRHDVVVTVTTQDDRVTTRPLPDRPMCDAVNGTWPSAVCTDRPGHDGLHNWWRRDPNETWRDARRRAE